MKILLKFLMKNKKNIILKQKVKVVNKIAS